jgi:hypothetical protein
MSNALAEPPCLAIVSAESRASVEPSGTLAVLCERVAAVEALPERVAALERRLVKRRPDSNARRMTRVDRCPFGWKPHPRNPRRLIEDAAEQQMIFRLAELARAPMSLRELCRELDATGCKRRGGKKWAGAHGLVRSILRREGILTPTDAMAAVHRRIEETKRRAADRYCPETLSDYEARARARGECM